MKFSIFNRAAMVCAIAVFGAVLMSPASAQDKKPAGKDTKKTVKPAAKMYQCQHCKEPMSLAAATKKGMKCCGMKMVEVKTAKKSDPKKG